MMSHKITRNTFVPPFIIREEPAESRQDMEIKLNPSRDSAQPAHQNSTPEGKRRPFIGRVGAFFHHLFRRKKKRRADRDPEDIPSAVIGDNVTALVHNIETTGVKDIVPASEKKTEATSGTDCAANRAVLPRGQYRLVKKTNVPQLTTQEEPAGDGPHPSREFVQQSSTTKGKRRLFFGRGKALFCPFCCRTKVDAECTHKNDLKASVAPPIDKTEDAAATKCITVLGISENIYASEKDTNPTTIVETVPAPRDGTVSTITEGKKSIFVGQTETTSSLDRVHVSADELKFTHSAETEAEPKDGIKNSIPTEAVPIQEHKAEITTTTANVSASEIKPVVTRGKYKAPNLRKAAFRRKALTRIIQKKPEEDKPLHSKEAVLPAQQINISVRIDDPPPPTPESFDYYKMLGQGMYGKVFLTSHPVTDQMLAMKITRKPTRIKKMFIERHAMVATDGCRFFPQLFATFQTMDFLFYVMEYVDGVTLNKFIESKCPLSIDTIRFIAAELLCAIQILHSRDIAHCDLHANNILVDSTGHVKIIDFGLAKKIDIPPGRSERHQMAIEERLSAISEDYTFFRSALSYLGRCRDTQECTGNYAHIKDLFLKSQHSTDGLREHPFFTGINWDELEAGNLRPPHTMEARPKVDLQNKIDVKDLLAEIKQDFYRIARRYPQVINGFEYVSERWRDMCAASEADRD